MVEGRTVEPEAPGSNPAATNYNLIIVYYKKNCAMLQRAICCIESLRKWSELTEHLNSSRVFILQMRKWLWLRNGYDSLPMLKNINGKIGCHLSCTRRLKSRISIRITLPVLVLWAEEMTEINKQTNMNKSIFRWLGIQIPSADKVILKQVIVGYFDQRAVFGQNQFFADKTTFFVANRTK